MTKVKAARAVKIAPLQKGRVLANAGLAQDVNVVGETLSPANPGAPFDVNGPLYDNTGRRVGHTTDDGQFVQSRVIENPNDLPKDINGKLVGDPPGATHPSYPGQKYAEGTRVGRSRREVEELVLTPTLWRDANDNLVIPANPVKTLAVNPNVGVGLPASGVRGHGKETSGEKKARIASDKSAAKALKVANAKAAKQAKVDAAAAKKAEAVA